MKIGIISDTHDQTQKCEQAIEILEKETSTVIHCGDFDTFNTWLMFQGKKFKFKYVTGNEENRRAYRNIDGTRPLNRIFQVPELSETIGKVEIGAYHNTYERFEGHSTSIVYEQISSGKYDYFLYGHIHYFNIKFPEENCQTVAINPGSMKPNSIQGTGDEVDLSSFAILDLEKREVELWTYNKGCFYSTLIFLLNTCEYQLGDNRQYVVEYLQNLKRYFDSDHRNYKYVWSDGDHNLWWNNYFRDIFQEMGLK